MYIHHKSYEPVVVTFDLWNPYEIQLHADIHSPKTRSPLAAKHLARHELSANWRTWPRHRWYLGDCWQLLTLVFENLTRVAENGIFIYHPICAVVIEFYTILYTQLVFGNWFFMIFYHPICAVCWRLQWSFKLLNHGAVKHPMFQPIYFLQKQSQHPLNPSRID